MVDYAGSYATPRADLGEALVEYQRETPGWIGTKILPPVDVIKKSATFSAFTRAAILQSAQVGRAARSAFNRIEPDIKDHTYACQDYGIEGAVDDQERELYASDFDADFTCMTVVDRVVRLAQEQRISAKVFSPTVMSTNYTDVSATAPWTQLSVDIFGQIIAAKELTRRLTGLNPNTIAVSRPTFNLMKTNTALQARRNVTILLSDKQATDDMRELFGVDQFLIGDEVFNAAAELNPATPSEVVTDIWAKQYCLVSYACRQGASLKEASLGRTAVWSAYAADMQVTSYREEQTRSDIVRVEQMTDEFVYDQAYGTLIKVQV